MKFKFFRLTISVLFLFFTSCNDYIKTPANTEREKEFFNQLNKKYHCHTSKRLETQDIEKDSATTNYVLFLDSIQSFDHLKDSFKLISFSIAKDLHQKVLGADYKYRYSHIAVSFIQEMGGGQTAGDFIYSIRELE